MERDWNLGFNSSATDRARPIAVQVVHLVPLGSRQDHDDTGDQISVLHHFLSNTNRGFRLPVRTDMDVDFIRTLVYNDSDRQRVTAWWRDSESTIKAETTNTCFIQNIWRAIQAFLKVGQSEVVAIFILCDSPESMNPERVWVHFERSQNC